MAGQILCPDCWDQVPPEMVKALKPLKKDRTSKADLVNAIQDHVHHNQAVRAELDKYVEMYK